MGINNLPGAGTLLYGRGMGYNGVSGNVSFRVQALTRLRLKGWYA